MNPSPEKVSVVQLFIAYPLLIPLIDRLNEAGAEDELKVISRQLTRLSFRAAARQLLEPISKSLEEDNEASELYEAEEVLGVVFPTDEDAALPLNPSKEALHEPASHIAA